LFIALRDPLDTLNQSDLHPNTGAAWLVAFATKLSPSPAPTRSVPRPNPKLRRRIFPAANSGIARELILACMRQGGKCRRERGSARRQSQCCAQQTGMHILVVEALLATVCL